MRAFRGIAYGRPVIVNLKSGSAIRGVLVREHRGGLLEVRSAEYLEAKLPPAPMDGAAMVPAASVDFVQQLPPTFAPPAPVPAGVKS